MSAEETSTMLYSLVDRPLAWMEMPFTSITEQATHAWRWQLVASVIFSLGWISIPALEMEMILNVPVIELERAT
jgi:hypothetical protein